LNIQISDFKEQLEYKNFVAQTVDVALGMLWLIFDFFLGFILLLNVFWSISIFRRKSIVPLEVRTATTHSFLPFFSLPSFLSLPLFTSEVEQQKVLALEAKCVLLAKESLALQMGQAQGLEQGQIPALPPLVCTYVRSKYSC
jgi:hypothetical protein